MNIRFTFLFLTIVLLTGCIVVVPESSELAQRAEQVQIGTTREQVTIIMNDSRQRTFTNPTNSDITYLQYCWYYVIGKESFGFFLYKDRVYKKIQRLDHRSESLHGIYQNYDDNDCSGTLRIDWTSTPTPLEMIADEQAERARRESLQARNAQIVSQDYFIDGLVIIHTQDTGAECVSGGDYKIEVRGDIGPDSSFALEELLRRSPNCLQENNEIKSRTTVELESLGGLLKDGYLMGRTFRTHEVKTIITSSSVCASSCAVAYLGGVDRLMENDSIIMFHSPYLPDLNAIGERIADCDIGSETTAQLLEYYQEMTSPEQGERLMNRTMSYCSAEDGWVLRGSAAAELFGVATEI